MFISSGQPASASCRRTILGLIRSSVGGSARANGLSAPFSPSLVLSSSIDSTRLLLSVSACWDWAACSWVICILQSFTYADKTTIKGPCYQSTNKNGTVVPR